MPHTHDSPNLTGIRFKEQTVDLATPPTGYWVLESKSDGFYSIEDTGTVKKLLLAGDVDLSTTVILAPSTSARNVIQPTADAVPITSKRFNAGATSNLYEAQAETGAVLAAIDKSGVVVSPIHAPLADGTTAIRITKADKTTDVVRIDTTNSRVGIGKTPTSTLDVNGPVLTTVIAHTTAGTLPIRANVASNGIGMSTTSLAPESNIGISLGSFNSTHWSDAHIGIGKALFIYNTVPSSSNYERGLLTWVSNEFVISMAALGTGVARPIVIIPSASSVVGLTVRGVASQTANLQNWQTSTPTTVASVDKDGQGLFAGLTITDAKDVVLGTTTGTKIGTVGGASGQKLAFWGSTAIVQPVLATGAGRTVDEVITVLQNLGLVRQS